jgi:hypothetical protein
MEHKAKHHMKHEHHKHHEHKHHEHKHHEHKMHEKHHEHKPHAEFHDNRMVHDKHQEGIGRVIQRTHEARDGHFGKMGMGHHSESNFKRASSAATPRKA